MKTSTTRRLIALGLGAALLLTGCANSDEDAKTSDPDPESEAAMPDSNTPPSAEDIAALEGVTLSGDAGEAPTLEFETPFAVSVPVARLAEEGDGDVIEDGDTISFHAVSYSGNEGSVIEGSDTFDGEATELPLNPEQVLSVLVETMTGETVGSRILFAHPFSVEDDVEVVGIEIVSTRETPEPLDGPEGEAVEPADGLPKVTLDDEGKPSIDIPADFEADELIVQPLIEGEGDVLKETDSITANYTGWKLDGEQFDSSWDQGQPATFPSLQQVIPGWTEGLAGQKVGSQVLLVIPPEMGYGGSPHELAEETLVFVVDILAA